MQDRYRGRLLARLLLDFTIVIVPVALSTWQMMIYASSAFIKRMTATGTSCCQYHYY